MELRQVEYFIAVAEERSFTRAAERTHVSQSGLSAAIRTLERELGSPLFHRTTRSVELSPAGFALLPKARGMLDLAAAGRDAVAATTTHLQGSLRLGSEQCLGVIDITELLARFHRRHPHVDIVFDQAGSTTLLERMRQGTLDVAFVATAGTHRPTDRLRWLPLAAEPLLLLCPPEHPLTEQEAVHWADLDGHRFIDLEPSWAAREINEDAFAAHGVQRRVGYTVNDIHTLIDLVRRGLGIALVPAPVARKPHAHGLPARPLADTADHPWRVSAVARTTDQVTSAFLQNLPDPLQPPTPNGHPPARPS
ncbi:MULTISPECIES: LysR family transcriptional regulator [unclassified Nocardiopsis]|uniref:LysR family transcriptional regulator n=1 Tax=Nocardiopsis TaxID=2013 RepID=UPI00387ADDEE